MRLGETRKATFRQPVLSPVSAEPAATEPAASRALVALTPVAETRAAPDSFRPAPFLAQLLAMNDRHPQTRERRRAEPSHALAAYRATAELTRFR